MSDETPDDVPSTWNPLTQQWDRNSDLVDRLNNSLTHASGFRAVELQLEIDALKEATTLPPKAKKPMSIILPTVIDRRASVADEVSAIVADDIDIERVVRRGWIPDDFKAIKSGHVIVSPVKGATKTAGGLHIANAVAEMSGVSALCFRVVALGDCRAHPEAMVRNLKPGDVVLVRSSMLDPLHRDMETLIIDASHIYSLVWSAA